MQTNPNNPQEQPSPPGLLMLNQVVGPLAVQLLTDLSARGIACRALTGWVEAEDALALPFQVIRARRLTKTPIWKRFWSWGVFTLQAIWTAARNRRTPLLVVTNPPWTMLAMPMLRWCFGVRYALQIYDIYPEVAERMGKLREGGLTGRLWRRLSRRSLLRAEAVITLAEDMAETLRSHLKPSDTCRIDVIPNWADTDVIHPRPKADNPFALRHGLTDKFVVMYSGAFGATHDFESILQAAEGVTDLPDVHFMLIGGGTRWPEVSEQVRRKALPNVTLLPFQPFDVLPLSLASADCVITCLDEGYEGLSVPSKTYYALAAGAALLAVSSPGTELSRLIGQYDCGVHIPPRSPDVLAGAVRRLHGDRAELDRMKSASRRAAETAFSLRACTEQYYNRLREAMME